MNPTERVRQLKHFSDTRWTSHDRVVDVIHLKYKESNDGVTASTAKSLIITTFETVDHNDDSQQTATTTSRSLRPCSTFPMHSSSLTNPLVADCQSSVQ